VQWSWVGMQSKVHYLVGVGKLLVGLNETTLDCELQTTPTQGNTSSGPSKLLVHHNMHNLLEPWFCSTPILILEPKLWHVQLPTHCPHTTSSSQAGSLH
jgi:hypothetical protein